MDEENIVPFIDRKLWSGGRGSTKNPCHAALLSTLVDFFAGIWSAALHGDLSRVKYFIQKATDPSQPDSAGYTALVSRRNRVGRENLPQPNPCPVTGPHSLCVAQAGLKLRIFLP
jgi:hypothetical protein